MDELTTEHDPAVWRKSIRDSRAKSSQWKEEGDSWRYKNFGLDSYLESFGSLVKKEELEAKQHAVGLDLMGQGQILRDLDIRGVGVTLVDPRNTTQVLDDRAHQRDIISGDVLARQTYKKIEKWLSDGGLSGFNLVFIRPLGGTEALPKNHPELYFTLLSRIWKMMDSEAMLLTEVPTFIPKDVVQHFIDQCNTNGVQAKFVQEETRLTTSIRKAGENTLKVQERFRKNPIKLKLIKPNSASKLPTL
ncbi:MAG: hypothetical protein UY49_C0011G0007 [Microgenomates group bacterium GW2011_GWC1_49_7]|nr:MAG: hypothetical protein UY49_C0011G0007 [Microgenomates group bacterium GW2011_GWC1_49_7]